MSKFGKSEKFGKFGSVNYYSAIDVDDDIDDDGKVEKVDKVGKKKKEKKEEVKATKIVEAAIQATESAEPAWVTEHKTIIADPIHTVESKRTAEQVEVDFWNVVRNEERKRKRIESKRVAEDDRLIANVGKREFHRIKYEMENKRKAKRLAADDFLTACVSKRGFRQSANNFQPCEMDDFAAIADYVLHTDPGTLTGGKRWAAVEQHLLSLCKMEKKTPGSISKCLIADYKEFLNDEVDTSLRIGDKTDALVKYLEGLIEVPDEEDAQYSNALFLAIAFRYLHAGKFPINKQTESKLRSTISALLKECDNTGTATFEIVDGCEYQLKLSSLQAIIELFRGRAHETAELFKLIRNNLWHDSSNADSTTGSAGYFCSGVKYRGDEVDKSTEFDLEANALALECGAATPEQQEQIFAYVERHWFANFGDNCSTITTITRSQAKMLLQMSRADPGTVPNAYQWHALAHDHFDKWCAAYDARGQHFETGAVAALFCALDDQLRENGTAKSAEEVVDFGARDDKLHTEEVDKPARAQTQYVPAGW